jgi:hypothetical protein
MKKNILPTIRNLEALSIACSKDETRSCLCGINFSEEKKELCATDGHIVVIIALNDDEITFYKEVTQEFLLECGFKRVGTIFYPLKYKEIPKEPEYYPDYSKILTGLNPIAENPCKFILSGTNVVRLEKIMKILYDGDGNFIPNYSHKTSIGMFAKINSNYLFGIMPLKFELNDAILPESSPFFYTMIKPETINQKEGV